MTSRTAQAIALIDSAMAEFALAGSNPLAELRVIATFAALEMGLQVQGVYVAYLTKHPEFRVRCKCCNQVLRRSAK